MSKQVFTKEQKQDMLVRLKSARLRVMYNGFRDWTGICMLAKITASTEPLFHSIVIKWPLYSGNPLYPVPARRDAHPQPAFHAVAEYYDARTSGRGLWNQKTEYGQLRWELLNFCIDELRKELKDES